MIRKYDTMTIIKAGQNIHYLRSIGLCWYKVARMLKIEEQEAKRLYALWKAERG